MIVTLNLFQGLNNKKGAEINLLRSFHYVSGQHDARPKNKPLADLSARGLF